MSLARESAGPGGACWDPAALYRRYERPLRAWLGRRVSAPAALVEDASASAWLILVAKRPACNERIFGWLCTTALHEAYRLLRLQKREQPSELGDERPALVPSGRDEPEIALEARRALVALASLRERQRRYIAWQVGGYREMQALAGGATYTNVNKHLVRGRARLRALADEASERPASVPGRGGAQMATGSCRKCGLRPRRVRRGSVEPLCEECYREPVGKVARELAEEATADGRTRFRRMKLVRGARPAERAPERVAPVARAGEGPLRGRARCRQRAREGEPASGRRARCISEELLREARRLYGLGLSLRGVAETLLDETNNANAHSAEVALRSQFKRRGWPLRTRAQAQRARRAPEGEERAPVA